MLHRLECKTKGLVFTPFIETAHKGYGNYPLVWDDRKKIIKPGDFIETPSIRRRSWKVAVKSREGKELLWVRPFQDINDALLIYMRLIGINIEELGDRTIQLPSTWSDGELEYQFATIETFTANGTWNVPGGVSTTDYLIVAGGGGAGNDGGGGGGAGGMKEVTAASVSGSYAITIGAKGTTGDPAVAGGTSSIGALDSTSGGGKGGSSTSANRNGSNGGSGGGAWRASGNTSGTGTSGQGNDGGTNSPTTLGAGGGGKGSVGGTADGNGGSSQNSSMSGASVAYAGGGAGANTGGGGGTGGGAGAGNGGPDNQNASIANRGSGGGASSGTTGGDGSAGIVIFSYTINVYPITPGGVESRFFYKDEIVGY